VTGRPPASKPKHAPLVRQSFSSETIQRKTKENQLTRIQRQLKRSGEMVVVMAEWRAGMIYTAAVAEK